jgi:glutamine amidotransferase
MCRIFGFRSVIQSQVHSSLLGAENALSRQSEFHPDGWGVAYYVANAPHVVKSATQAMECGLFQRVSGIVSSETVLAHIRKATQGEHSSLNSHPFQYGRWVMAHNGDIPGFSDVKEELLQNIAPILRRYILGDTDSEVIFYLFLTALSQEVELHRQGTALDPTVRALRNTVSLVRKIADKKGHRALLTIAITNGELMVVHEGGKDLHVSTHKKSCNESDSCPFYKPECIAPTETGYVSHFIASSEPLQGQNVWRKLNEGDIVAVDFHMKYHEILSQTESAQKQAVDAA